MSIIEELKRRNVFKVGTAYVIVAWLLLQFADMLLDNIGADAWVLQAIMIVLAIGFFITLFVAWAFEMTPEGIKREEDVDRTQSITPQTGKKLNTALTVLLALAVGYILFDKFSGQEMGSEPFSQESNLQTQQVEEEKRDPTPAKPADTRQSIAVLPFENRSNREEDQFFTDGIHDDLLTTIARIGSMKVISRTSVMEYKNTTKKIPEIAKELGVANILEGGIQRSGNQVRINVQLIDAVTDEHLWAEIFDRELTAENLFSIQSEISTRIAEALQTALSPEEVDRINRMPTDNLQAYDAYLRGKQLMATRGAAELEQATAEFQKAVELDPNFALAWVGVADSTQLFSNYGSLPEAEAMPIMQDAIERALAIDNQLGEAYASLGMLHSMRQEIVQMEIAFKQAIKYAPNYATAYHWYSNNIRGFLSRAQQSVDLARKAIELDPRSAIIGSNLAGSYQAQGLYSLSEQQFLKGRDLHPDFPNASRGLSNQYSFIEGKYDKGLQYNYEAGEKDPGSLLNLAFRVAILSDIGEYEWAERVRETMNDRGDRDWRLGWADVVLQQSKGNAEGMREAWRSMKQTMPRSFDFFANSAGLFELTHNSPEKALNIFLETQPGWVEQQEWDRLIDMNGGYACLIAYAFLVTGENDLGQALLEKTMTALDQLQAQVEHIDYFNPEFCYLAAGDTERALTTIETQLAHGHLFWWPITHKLPFFESIKFEPRYQSAVAERERIVAEQVERINQMNLESGP